MKCNILHFHSSFTGGLWARYPFWNSLKHRKKDGCPGKLKKKKKNAECTKGLENWLVGCTQTKEHWKEGKSRIKVNIHLTQKLNTAVGVPAAMAGKLTHRVALEMVQLNFCSTLCSHNWPEPLASGGRQITHSKTSRTQRSQSQISPLNYLHIKSVCKYIWSLNCFCMLWLTRNRNTTFRDTFSYCLSISQAEQAAKSTPTIELLQWSTCVWSPFASSHRIMCK